MTLSNSINKSQTLERPRCSPRAGISKRMFVVAIAVDELENRRIKYVGDESGEFFIHDKHLEQQFRLFSGIIITHI